PVRLAFYLGNTPPWLTGTGGSFDGLPVADGDRVLVIGAASPVPFYTGIWVAHAGNWTRAGDFASASDFSQGVVVPVDSGNNCGGSYWQAQSTVGSWTNGGEPSDVF